MNNESYIFPVILAAFFGYRFYKSYSFKKKLPELLSAGAVIIDVRSAEEFSSGHNPNSQNIPLDLLNAKSSELVKDKTYILCCASGTRSGMALGIMKKNGFKSVVNGGPWTNTLAN